MPHTAAGLWKDRLELGPKRYAELYTAAAEQITARGYTAYENCEGETGISIGTALYQAAVNTAADGTVPAVVHDLNGGIQMLADDLETRLTAVLIAAGLASNDHYGVGGWERALNHYDGAADSERAFALLTAAAQIMTALHDSQPAPDQSLASCGHPANEDGECGCSSWPERAPAI